jgi:hypothetical protein
MSEYLKKLEEEQQALSVARGLLGMLALRRTIL